ncbi:MAG: hypothetical protein KGL70_12020 [Betaproteobacteria bacterium]|nr:hypothetical protein [Betaproteobacteria bacterium]MDE2003514.1 hypothetical protein [Betaproteobacteria bacterium]MDE2360097.1 hypothetical protein [Betaproteobacteria bacterium]
MLIHGEIAPDAMRNTVCALKDGWVVPIEVLARVRALPSREPSTKTLG